MEIRNAVSLLTEKSEPDKTENTVRNPAAKQGITGNYKKLKRKREYG